MINWMMIGLSCIVTVLMVYIIREDYLHRRVPNKGILVLMIVGIIYSVYSKNFAALLWFFVINVCGIGLSSRNFMSAGDWKLFSLVPFFIGQNTSLYAIWWSVWAILFVGVALFRRYRMDHEKWRLHFLDEKNALHYMMITKRLPNYEHTKEQTLPFAIPFAMALVCTLWQMSSVGI